MKKQKIVVVQYWTENLSYGKYTKAINEKYCYENEYIYHVETNTDKILKEVDDRAITWYKPKLINEVFNLYNPDYILFLDADAIVCDFSYKIENFIEKDINILCTEDYGPSKINAGVFIMKNTKWTKDFLKKWWDICEIIDDGKYKHGLWHDQTCFGLLMDKIPNIENNIKIIENHKLNGRVFKDNYHKNFIFHAFSYGELKNRTIDNAYYNLFNLTPIVKDSDNLLDIVNNYNTDKNYEHNYFELIYDKIFSPLKYDVNKIIELGCLNGESLFLWRDFFKNANIIGVDKFLENTLEYVKGKNLERINLIKKDCSLVEDLNELNQEFNDVDIIIDDASHKMFDQQKSFAILFKSLKKGGIYVIEDLHTSLECRLPEKAIFQWGDVNKTTTLELLNEFNNSGEIVSEYLTLEEKNYLKDNIKSIKIFQSKPNWSITSIIIKK